MIQLTCGYLCLTYKRWLLFSVLTFELRIFPASKCLTIERKSLIQETMFISFARLFVRSIHPSIIFNSTSLYMYYFYDLLSFCLFFFKIPYATLIFTLDEWLLLAVAAFAAVFAALQKGMEQKNCEFFRMGLLEATFIAVIKMLSLYFIWPSFLAF